VEEFFRNADFVALIDETNIYTNLVATLILIVVIVFVRAASIRTIRKWNVPNAEMRRKWIVQTKNTAILLGLVGLLFIWGDELKTFAVSLVAIAVALVVATKELILCVLGGIFKAGTHVFAIGDRIEINGMRGDVIDHNLINTTLYEIGPGKDLHQFTGRVVVIPNSKFFTEPIINETTTGNYVLHNFKVPFKREDNWKQAREDLLKASSEVCESYLSDAKKQFQSFGKKEGIEVPSVDPRVSLAYPEPGRIDLVVRVPAPNTRKGKVEQAILARYEDLHDHPH
jgi:small-conductance mechanosensitive channel